MWRKKPKQTEEPEPNPLARVEALYQELVEHYGEGDNRELRAAAKLLLVALDKFRQHGGSDWQSLLDEYVTMAKQRPDKLERVMKCKDGESDPSFMA